MAKFINTRKAVSEIEDLIKNAGQNLTLISPYLKLSKDFRELLSYRNSKDKITTVIFGKQELNPDEMSFLQGLRFIILKYNESLHAKCYVNDDKMIITSMNLYQFSMANNKEMGVLIDKADPADVQLFEDASKEVEYIKETSQNFELHGPKSIIKVPDLKLNVEKSYSKPSNHQFGYCIRTGFEIPFNLEKPLSKEAYKKWNEHKNPDFGEKFCHFSGELSNGTTSLRKPILSKNWKKAKEIFSLS
ncbi:MAG: phospholipase D family protein [Bacteroidota bacterium]|nr:phospholipase D family protein [Bacteroidota bacterium]